MEVNDVGREEKCIEGENVIIRSANAERQQLGCGKVRSLFHYKPSMQTFTT